jgi:nitroreductase
MELISSLNSRYATKAFDAAKKVSAEDMDTLLEAIRLSASSYGLQPYKVIVVENPEIRQELRGLAWGQSQITDSSALLVFAANTEINAEAVDQYISLISETRGIPAEALGDFSGMMKGSLQKMSAEQIETWVSKQAYIALGYGLVSAAVLGIDTCPMEGFSGPDFDKVLGLEKLGLKSKVVLAVGYRSSEDQYQHMKKVRTKKEDFFINI